VFFKKSKKSILYVSCDAMSLITTWNNHAKTLPREEYGHASSNYTVRSSRALSSMENVAGSSPTPLYRFTNKPQPSVVEGSTPKPVMLSWNRPVLNMTCKDIAGSHPCAVPFLERTNRSLDPLRPIYNLPSFETTPEVN
jgi:hypothetical protein